MSNPIDDPVHVGDANLTFHHIAYFQAGLTALAVLKPERLEGYQSLVEHINVLDSKIIAQLQAEAAKEIKVVNKSVYANHEMCVAVALLLHRDLRKLGDHSNIIDNPIFKHFMYTGKDTYGLDVDDEADFINAAARGADVRLAAKNV